MSLKIVRLKLQPDRPRDNELENLWLYVDVTHSVPQNMQGWYAPFT